MPSIDLEYPSEPFSTVKRYNSRGEYSISELLGLPPSPQYMPRRCSNLSHSAHYALETIHTLINSSPILNVSFNPPNSPFPTILPMIGQMGSFARPSADLGDVLELYLHGYVSSRVMNLTRTSPEGETGLPVCVSASFVDGLVLALTPNAHSYNYRSAVLFGYAELVTDVEEKLFAMELITNGVVRDRWRHTRVPPNAAEMASTSVLRVRVKTGSAKIRSGQPHDDKADVDDEALLDSVWTGVVPVYQTYGTPVPSPYNRIEVPDYLKEHARDENSFAKETAETNAVKETVPPKVRE